MPSYVHSTPDGEGVTSEAGSDPAGQVRPCCPLVPTPPEVLGLGVSALREGGKDIRSASLSMTEAGAGGKLLPNEHALEPPGSTAGSTDRGARRTVSESDPISVFGLSETQLRPIVETAVGKPVTSFEISIEHQVEGDYGFAAEKLIPTFSYVTHECRRGRVTIFAKHSHNPESPEAGKYRLLATHGVPAPRVYGLVCSPEDRPILFLEYLDVSEQAQSVTSTENLLELLSLIARVNAIRPTPEQAALLGSWWDGPATEVSTFEVLWEDAQKGNLGEGLQQFCASRRDELPRLLAFTHRLEEQAREMEMGVLHNDFSPGNTGRRATGERVVMDPELMGLGPRFGDVSGWLGRPEDLWQRKENQRDLAEHYLREHARWGGSPPSLDECLEECHLLWVYGLCNLDFGLGLARADSDTCEEYRANSRRGLLKRLTLLLNRYC